MSASAELENGARTGSKKSGPKINRDVAREQTTQALGRLPWFAPLFLRLRRLRARLLMGASSG